MSIRRFGLIAWLSFACASAAAMAGPTPSITSSPLTLGPNPSLPPRPALPQSIPLAPDNFASYFQTVVDVVFNRAIHVIPHSRLSARTGLRAPFIDVLGARAAVEDPGRRHERHDDCVGGGDGGYTVESGAGGAQFLHATGCETVIGKATGEALMPPAGWPNFDLTLRTRLERYAGSIAAYDGIDRIDADAVVRRTGPFWHFRFAPYAEHDAGRAISVRGEGQYSMLDDGGWDFAYGVRVQDATDGGRWFQAELVADGFWHGDPRYLDFVIADDPDPAASGRLTLENAGGRVELVPLADGEGLFALTFTSAAGERYEETVAADALFRLP